jgi:hypothetical protein
MWGPERLHLSGSGIGTDCQRRSGAGQGWLTWGGWRGRGAAGAHPGHVQLRGGAESDPRTPSHVHTGSGMHDHVHKHAEHGQHSGVGGCQRQVGGNIRIGPPPQAGGTHPSRPWHAPHAPNAGVGPAECVTQSHASPTWCTGASGGQGGRPRAHGILLARGRGCQGPRNGYNLQQTMKVAHTPYTAPTPAAGLQCMHPNNHPHHHT